jgi:hypothetical protein
LGYDKESDNTWEDEENCLGSKQLLDTYWESRGGRPDLTKPGPGRKRKVSTPLSEIKQKKRHSSPSSEVKSKRRQSSSVVGENHTPSKNRVREASSWKVPYDIEEWDPLVARVDTIEKTDTGLIMIELEWYGSVYCRVVNGVGMMDIDRAMIRRLFIKSVLRKYILEKFLLI